MTRRGTSETALPPKRPKGLWRRTLGRLPKSTFLNFGALLILFTLIWGLQHFGQHFISPGSDKAAATPEKTSTKVAELPVQTPKTTPGPDLDLAAQTELPRLDLPLPSPGDGGMEPAAQPTAAKAEIAPATEETPAAPKPKQAVAKPAPEKPRIAARETKKMVRTRTAPPQRRSEEDRNVRIDELDNESARLRYLHANRGLAGTPAQSDTLSPTYMPTPSTTKLSTAKDYFIPFEKK